MCDCQGVENIYAQHKPLLHSLLDQAIRGKLREAAYPYLGTSQLKDRSVLLRHGWKRGTEAHILMCAICRVLC